MKRKRILTQFLLYFLMFMFLIVAGCSDSDDDNDTTTDATVDRWVTVSGTVTTASGPLQGVLMSMMFRLEVMGIELWEGSINSSLFGWKFTDENGYYEITVPSNLVEDYTFILTPSKKGYTFRNTSIYTGQTDVTIPISGQDNITGVNFTATESHPFSQPDLVGTWRINMLRAGTDNLWMRARVKIGVDGTAECKSMYYSSDPTNNLCLIDDPASTDPTVMIADPSFEWIFTMDEDGVITQDGSSAPVRGGHMTMNSLRKNFAAGTGTNGTSYQLMIMQKEDVAVTTPAAAAGTTHYTAADMYGRSFVFHSLSVGGTNEWRYGQGSTAPVSAAIPGLISQPAADGEYNPAGATGPSLNWVLSLATDGYVTRTDAAGLLTDFQGFLSADERTIVGTYSEGGNYRMIVIQFTEGQNIDEMTGYSTNHLLGAATGLTPLWAYHNINISRFETTVLRELLGLNFPLNVMLSYDWHLADYLNYSNAELLLLLDLERINIASAGTATIMDTSTTPDTTEFHGQLSSCGTFMVGVETLSLDEGDFYALDVITKQ